MDSVVTSDCIDVTSATLVQVTSGLFFAAVNYVLAGRAPPATLNGDVWRWRNTFVSWIHAVIVGLWDLYCITLHREVFDDLLHNCDNVIYLLLAVSQGYFVFDFLYHLYSGKMITNWEVIAHHVIVIWTFWYSLQYKFVVPFTIVALTTEINSIFLHGRKLLQLIGWSFDHWLYTCCLVLNLLTFVVFRLGCVVCIIIGLYVYKTGFPVVYWVTMGVSMAVIFAINLVLLWRLFKNDVLRRLRKPKPEMQANGDTCTNNVKHQKGS